ncbi:hypothetical protein MHTCC0001_09810 [Flavobacteriaceae bacterium MHTCC 0001]
MQVICLDEEAFYSLFNKVVEHLDHKYGDRPRKWISDQDAMSLLNIKSKTTLQELRDNGDIGFSQPRKKVILYDRDSINAYLEKHAKKPFR